MKTHLAEPDLRISPDDLYDYCFENRHQMVVAFAGHALG